MTEAKFYNPKTAKWEVLKDEALLAEHEAQKDGKPAPGDRTERELRDADPSIAGPILTSSDPNAEAAALAAAEEDAKQAEEDAKKKGGK